MIFQVDLSDPEQLDGRQLEFMQKKAKVRVGEETARPPQIFNKTYRGVKFFYFHFLLLTFLSPVFRRHTLTLFQDFLDFLSADEDGLLEEFLGVKITSWQLTKVNGANFIPDTELCVSAKETTSEGVNTSSKGTNTLS